MTTSFWHFIEIFSISLSIILPLLMVIAFFTLLERKVMASLQRRIGPTVHGYYGALQPLIDGLKLLWKEMLVPAKANFFIFIFSPMFMMSLSFALWAVLPLSFSFTMFDSKLSLITFFVISSLNVYNIILAGWSSNSKYAFLGSVRAMGQMFSYELVLGFVMIFMLLTVGSLRIYDIVVKQYYVGYLALPLLPFAIIFFISLLMETNRSPFDLAESESELVAGYNVEYSSIMFAMFFLAEYCNILAMSSVWSLLFWGGFIANYFGVGVFVMKILTICFLFIFIRSLLPRYRIDQLIYIGWHVMLPLALGLCIFIAFIASVFNIFPKNAALYLDPTVPENYDLSMLFKDFSGTKEETREALQTHIINEFIKVSSANLEGDLKIIHKLATRDHLDVSNYSFYIAARHERLMSGDPALFSTRLEQIALLNSFRHIFNSMRYFIEWLITEEGKLPVGWTEHNYISYITGSDPYSFYKYGENRDATGLHGGLAITLKNSEALFLSNRSSFQLPSILLENRGLIAPSKYALLSDETKALLDKQFNSYHTQHSQTNINWINDYSDALDKATIKERKVHLADPFTMKILDDRSINHDILREKAEKEWDALELEKLRNYEKDFPTVIHALCTPEQMEQQPGVCNDRFEALFGISIKPEGVSGGTCPLYSPSDDVTELATWGTEFNKYMKQFKSTKS